MKRLLVILLLSVNWYVLYATDKFQRPHIIIIYADDLGWNDVSFHGSPQIPTPNIDALALNGIVLNNYYAEWLCTPSRAALMTGKYPIRLGLQHSVIRAGQNSGLPLGEVILPQHLKRLGYKTHLVGKWHLGYSTKELTPTYRGFDTFFGYYNGVLDYYDYTNYERSSLPNQPIYTGIDLHNGTKLVTDFRGEYATHVFADAATNIIKSHDKSKPLFLYLSHLAVHAGNSYKTLQAPPDVISKFRYIKDINRRIQAAMTSVLDDSVGTVFEALHHKGMLNNSIVIFASDNGGETEEKSGAFSSNYPLRGQKFTFWEGGIRVPAVVWSPLLKLDKPLISNHLMHVSDWLPTLYRAAGGQPKDLGKIDGYDMWKSMRRNISHDRTKILHNLDPITGISALRWGDLKLVNGTTAADRDAWYGVSGLEDIKQPASMYDWVFKNGSVVRDILRKNGAWIAKDPDSLYRKVQTTCERPLPERATRCNPVSKPCLFNTTEDPCEYTDLADDFPEVAKNMMDAIHEYGKEAVPPQPTDVDPRADPMCHNFSYVSWLDPEHYTECSYAQ